MSTAAAAVSAAEIADRLDTVATLPDVTVRINRVVNDPAARPPTWKTSSRPTRLWSRA